jgi:hypothetical protein
MMRVHDKPGGRAGSPAPDRRSPVRAAIRARQPRADATLQLGALLRGSTRAGSRQHRRGPTPPPRLRAADI